MGDSEDDDVDDDGEGYEGANIRAHTQSLRDRARRRGLRRVSDFSLHFFCSILYISLAGLCSICVAYFDLRIDLHMENPRPQTS